MFQVFGWVGVEGARLRIITTFINTWSQLHVRVWLIFKLCKGFGRKSSKAIKKRWVKSWLDGERNGAVFTAHCSGALEQRTGRDMNTQGWPACLLGRASHCSVRSKAKSKGQNYPNLHKNVRRTCSHQKQQIFIILITTSSYNNISLICDFIQIDKTKQKQKNMNKERCMCIANHQKQWQRLFRKWWTRGHGPIFIQSLLTGVKGSHLIVTHS